MKTIFRLSRFSPQFFVSCTRLDSPISSQSNLPKCHEADASPKDRRPHTRSLMPPNRCQLRTGRPAPPNLLSSEPEPSTERVIVLPENAVIPTSTGKRVCPSGQGQDDRNLMPPATTKLTPTDTTRVTTMKTTGMSWTTMGRRTLPASRTLRNSTPRISTPRTSTQKARMMDMKAVITPPPP